MSRRYAFVLAAASLAALGAYAVFAHRLTVSADRSTTGYVFALGTLLATAIACAWPSPRRWRWIAAALLLIALGWHAQRLIDWDPRWIYVAQHAGAHGMLAVAFGSTLRTGSQPLVTRLALAVHRTLPVPMLQYTRQVTVAWTAYFVVMTAASVALFAAGATLWWSVLANFVTPPAIALLFVGEYLVRRRRFPSFAHVSPLEGLRAYSRQTRPRPSDRRQAT